MRLGHSFGLTAEPPRESSAFKWLTSVMIPAGAVLMMVVERYDDRQPGLGWRDLIVYGFVLSTTVAVGYALWPEISGVLARISAARRRAEARREYREPLLKMWKRAQDQLEDNRNTLVRLIRDAESWEGVRNSSKRVHNAEHISTLRSWHTSIGHQLDLNDPANFLATAVEMGKFIYQFNGYAVENQGALEYLVREKKLEPGREGDLKKEWTMRREEHQALIRDWKHLADSINVMVGHEFVQGYYPDLAPL